MFRNILVPTDGSINNQKTLKVAASLAEKYDAKLHVLCVTDVPEALNAAKGDLECLVNDMLVWAKKVVIETADTLRKSGIKQVEEHLRKGHAAEEIVAGAHQWDIDLIIIGTHGHRGMDRVLLGTIAEEVVRSSPIPVMTVRM